MAKIIANNLDDILRQIENDINETLADEVADDVSEKMTKNIQKVVYDVYEPKFYTRRGSQGGLLDKSNIVRDEVLNGELYVYNIAESSSYVYQYGTGSKLSKNAYRLLSDLIVTGGESSYDFYQDEYGYPRDFIAATRADISLSNSHTKALKRGLQKRGFTVL